MAQVIQGFIEDHSDYLFVLDYDLLEESLSIDELKTKALEVNSNDEYPSLIFPNVEIIVDEDEIEIVSKIKLNLDGIEVDNIIEK